MTHGLVLAILHEGQKVQQLSSVRSAGRRRAGRVPSFSLPFLLAYLLLELWFPPFVPSGESSMAGCVTPAADELPVKDLDDPIPQPSTVQTWPCKELSTEHEDLCLRDGNSS